MAKLTIEMTVDEGWKSHSRTIIWDDNEILAHAKDCGSVKLKVKKKDIVKIFNDVVDALPEKVEENITYSITSVYGVENKK